MRLLRGRGQPQGYALLPGISRKYMERPWTIAIAPGRGWSGEPGKNCRPSRIRSREQQKAHHWLNSPNRALGGVTPMSMLETEGGAHEVINILGRIDYGVYS